VSAVLRIARGLRGRAGVAAIVSLGVAWGLLMHSMGWAQSSFYAQVRALADGGTEIDRWHWETQDKAWVDGHFYSVKAPGLAAFTLPAYLGLDAVGAEAAARDAAANADATEHPRWTLAAGTDPPFPEFGYKISRARNTWDRIGDEAPIVWALTLVGAVVPAVLLLLLVRWVANRIEPGYGAAAAITLGLGTIVMTFASEYMSHVIAATFGFAAFALLFREREGPERVWLVGIAGLLAGLAVTLEYPLGLVGVVLFLYALARQRRVARGAAYAAGAAAGAAPALLYNLWSLGSPLKFAYGDAVVRQGSTGHAELGLNDDGFFGITFPRPESAFDLLFAGRGLLTLTPVLAMALVGVFLMHRRGRVTEARVIGAIAALYFVYNAGYWLTYGGGTPGPRFLIPALPFLAIGLATAYRRLPALTLALAIPSALFMIAGTLTFPLIGDNGTWIWVERLQNGILEHTVLTVLGVSDAWLAVVPVLVAFAAAVAFAAMATPRTPLGNVRPALTAILGWVVIAIVGPTLTGDPVTPLSGGSESIQLIALAAAGSALTLLVLSHRERRAERAAARLPRPEPALGERAS
jgi:4-amino-4-deoxy-L-arabinose transferase-like glycosyltransferase